MNIHGGAAPSDWLIEEAYPFPFSHGHQGTRVSSAVINEKHQTIIIWF
jgi:hypothetical protein